MSRLWIIGAVRAGINEIEGLLRKAGETVAYATADGATRVAPETADKAVGFLLEDGFFREAFFEGTVYLVECDVTRRGFGDGAEVVKIDHRNPGDPGYGIPAAQFLRGSSIGQVLSHLACKASVGSLEAIGLFQRASYTGAPRGHLWSAWGSWDLRVHNGPACVPGQFVLAGAASFCPDAALRGECPGVNPEEFAKAFSDEY